MSYSAHRFAHMNTKRASGHTLGIAAEVAAEKAQAEADTARRASLIMAYCNISDKVRAYVVRYAVPVTYKRSSH